MASDLSSNVALLAAAVAAGLTLILFLYAVGLRVANILHARDLARLRKRWWPIIAEASFSAEFDKAGDLLALKRGSSTKLLREWCRFRAYVRDSSNSSLQLLAEQLGLRRVARKLLHQRSVSNKLLAIQALGFLGDDESWDDIEALLESDNVTISIMAATALMYIDAGKAIHIVMPLIGKRTSWPRTQVGRMLNLAGADVVTGPLCDAIEKADADEASRLLRFYESVSLNDADSLIARLLTSRSEPVFLAAALKAVRGQLPDEVMQSLATHEVGYVRMQAANLLGRSGRREDYRILEPLLSDADWWVRYRAAQAITKLPFLGPNALRKLRNRQNDPYAHDILSQAMAEAGIE